MGTQQQDFNSLLEKMSRNDKDYRYMACSDLANNLEKENFRLDSSQEQRLSVQLLKLIVTDTNGEVQTLAQNCLGPFIKKCSENQIKETINSLLGSLAVENISYRDNSSFGLKTIINHIPQKYGSIILKELIPKLIEILEATGLGIDVKSEALDIIPVAIQRFGSSFESPSVYEPLKTVILQQLLSNRKNNRKRAGICIANLALYFKQKDFKGLIEFLVQNTKCDNNHEIVKSCVQTLGNLSKSAGFRLADLIDDVVPTVIDGVKGEIMNIRSSQAEVDDELRENCFQTLESLILRCPNTIGPHTKSIVELCMEFINHDPNFFQTSDDENEMAVDDEEDNIFEEEEEEDYDNEDVSWKVRKAASKTISAIISTRQEMLPFLSSEVAPILVKRFSEREETVKIDIFKTFENYLKQVHHAVTLRELGPAEKLLELVPLIIRSLTKILNEKTLKIKIRIGIFSLLKELVQVTNNSLVGQLNPLIPGIVNSLSDKSGTSNLKIEVLTFLRLLYSTHKPETFLDHIPQIIDHVIACVGDNYYKINAEALRLCTTLIEVIAAAPQGSFKDIIAALYNATLPKLKAQDIDQEVKETAINTASSLITHLADCIPEQNLEEYLKILESRLSNEITRLTCVKNLSMIANSKLKVNLNSILNSCVSQMTSFLKLNNRQLRQSSLITLDSFYKTQGATIHGLIPELLEQAALLIGDDDLQLSHLALQLTNTVLIRSEDANIIKIKIFPRILKLIESKVLQGLALESLLTLLETCTMINAEGFGFQTIFSAIDELSSKPSILKQSYSSIAQVIASICTKTSEANRNAAVNKYISELKVKENLKKCVLALLCIGEIGRRVDLSNISGLESIIIDTFNDNTEDIKSSASFCLGNMAVGNLQFYLPLILKDINNENHQYLLFHSLREVIVKLSTSEAGIQQLQKFLNEMLQVLYENCHSDKEVIRNVVAECLGRLTLVEPEILINGLKRILLDETSPHNRWTAVTAIKFAIVDFPRDINEILKPHIRDFLSLLNDSDLNVKKAALLTFNCIAHNKPILIIDLLGGEEESLLSSLYKESEVKQELLRKVKVGPFHHLVDDGLENRKAAFECMSTLMEKCLSKLDLTVFIQYLVVGLRDHSADIKSMCHIILERLAASPIASASIIQSLELFVEPLQKTLESKPKDTAVKQDKDRYEELVRSTLRAIYAIYRLPGVETSVKFANFIKQVVLVGEIGEKFKYLQESSNNDS